MRSSSRVETPRPYAGQHQALLPVTGEGAQHALVQPVVGQRVDIDGGFFVHLELQGVAVDGADVAVAVAAPFDVAAREPRAVEVDRVVVVGADRYAVLRIVHLGDGLGIAGDELALGLRGDDGDDVAFAVDGYHRRVVPLAVFNLPVGELIGTLWNLHLLRRRQHRQQREKQEACPHNILYLIPRTPCRRGASTVLRVAARRGRRCRRSGRCSRSAGRRGVRGGCF